MELAKLFFVGAELFFTVGAGKALVGRLIEPLRVAVVSNLPFDEQGQPQSAQTPGEKAGNKQQRREHHGIVPVIDATGDAAFVLQNPGLEWTEKQNTDHIADGIGQTDQQQNTAVDDAGEIQHTDQTVQRNPGDCGRIGGTLVFPGRIGGFIRLIIPLELLLTSHTFDGGREETKDHLHSKNDPYKGTPTGMLGKFVNRVMRYGTQPVKDIDDQHGQKYGRTKKQLCIVQSRCF